MVKLYDSGVYLLNGKTLVREKDAELSLNKEEAKKGTIAYGILQAHNTSGDPENLKIKFDAITSHDLTYVGIIQTARASGLDKFPLPYVLTCCHNSLCAVGGTINEDDHLFGLTACQKYGGIFVPPHMGVIHQYMRETMAGGGKMILGSDSHTRYGALGTMAVGEGWQAQSRHRTAGYCHRHRFGCLCQRLCQEQSHGVRRTRRFLYVHRLPQRH